MKTRNNEILDQCVLIDTPLLNVKEYARRSGLTEGAVRKRIGKGVIPVVSQGGRVMVNNAKILVDALKQDYC